MRLNFRKMGEGKPLFILHGLFGLSDNWNTVGKILAEHFQIYLIDLRNHGSSPHSDEWTYPAMAEDILKLTQDEKIYKITLLGHSLGGKVAMQFASMYPEKLEKLIVVDMAPKYYSTDRNMDFTRNLLQVNLSEMKSRKEAEEKILSVVDKWNIAQLLLKNIYWNDDNKLAWKLNLKVIADNVDIIEKTFSQEKKSVNTPTLFIRGEKSNYILDSDIAEIKKIFPHSEYKTIEAAGHWVHADKPSEFAEEIIKFII